MPGEKRKLPPSLEENMRSKSEIENRRKEILNIIAAQTIMKQGDLLSILNDRGYEASQSTLSRDLKVLKVYKNENTGFTLADEAVTVIRRKRLKRALQEYSCSAAIAVEPMAVKTAPGYARSVAVMIEESFKEEVFGTISGEDTILVMARVDKASNFSEELKKLLDREGVHEQTGD